MKSKRFALVLVAVLIVTLGVPVVAANNPFADVPADHWAYDSVVQLAAVGLVEGYPDGTYGGTRTLTRYEAAMVFARALARLEALVEEQVITNTAGVKDQITVEVLDELEILSDELSALIIAEFENLDIPVVEVEVPVEKEVVTEVVKEVVEVQPVERPFVMTDEAEAVIAELVGNLAKEYLAEASDLAKETIVETGVIERVVVEDVDEEVVKAIAEEVLAASLYSVQTQIDSNAAYVDMITTRINDRLGRLTRNVDVLKADYNTDIAAVNGLISALQGDVAELQAALEGEVANLSSTLVNVNNEFESELDLLGVRVDSLEMLYANLDGRVAEVEGAVVGLEDDVDSLEVAVTAVDQRVDEHEADYAEFKAETERVKLGGSLNVKGTTRSVMVGDSEVASATGVFNTSFDTTDLELETSIQSKLTAQISEGTAVNLTYKGKGATPLSTQEFNNFVLEVVSDTPVERFAFGNVGGSDLRARFDGNALSITPKNSALADVALGNFGINVLAGRDEGVGTLGALGFEYEVIPEFGFNLTGAALVDKDLSIGESAVAAGIFGEILGVNYGAKVAMDRYADDATDNLMFDVNVGADLGILSIDANWALANENFGTGPLSSKSFIDGSAQTKLGLDANTDLFGADIFAGTYMEKDADGENLINATMLEVGYGFDLFVPIHLSGAYGWFSEDDVHTKLKVGVSDIDLFGVDLGGSFTFVNNHINGDWRNPGKWLGQDANIIAVGVGYDTDLNSANLDLGYDFELAMPRNTTADLFGNQMTHILSAGYGFGDGMSLNMAVKRVNLDDKAGAGEATVTQLEAGLGFSF